MNAKKKWTAIGAASVLGVGIVGGGAVASANAMSLIVDDSGATGIAGISTKNSSFDPLPDSTVSAQSVNSVDSTPSAPSPASPESAPSPVSNSPASANSPDSPNSPWSPDSNSPDSPDSND